MNFLRRLFRKEAPSQPAAHVATGIAAEAIPGGRLVIIVNGKAFGVTPEQLLRQHPAPKSRVGKLIEQHPEYADAVQAAVRQGRQVGKSSRIR